MSFADNLRAVRKQKNISQEELAALLDVSRQAVSKWEQGSGFPETEKLLVLSKELNVSLDYLMCGQSSTEEPPRQSTAVTGRVLIKAQDGKSIVNCYKVLSSPIFKNKKDEPKYALFGVDGSSFWGENSTLLGWYSSEEAITKEIDAILETLKNGEATYELKYAAKVVKGKGSFFSLKLKE